ncbi:ANTH-domain-containing protein [Phanerochaete sordida]|uniref:ANTH-domain-containing protein n=1 Tax=Phanerochaete sordida TaxID=48140 RepID=A0A9P3GAA9_9APHY|nr:ANTH-domain-containing protein [Phanerochaete sordida]
MSSFDKVVKLACKPKAAPPKPKYLDPIIAATWSEDGAVHDVCKALLPRFREPNVIIVFKALIVLHTMIRNGATDNVLSYLSSSDVLRLKNISSGAHWEGYQVPQNLQNYAVYLDARIKAYRDLKHDAIRVQSESNRDMRNSAAIEEDKQHAEEERTGRRFGRRKRTSDDSGPTPSSSLPQRSKTIAGRKLRVMTVEKGLLRETKVVQKMIDSLVECRFYLDTLEDELNITALRMLVKDLLILFQACNEGVINVLEHYFEMSKIDAKEALAIYRHFCNETEKVVEYLGVAKKLQNLLNVPIPNLRHAPVSLAGALEEYLNDPNFEQNRIEYKTNKEIADRNARNGVKSAPKPAEKESKPDGSAPSSSTSPPKTEAKQNSQAMIDFFTSIEAEQQTMFNPQTGSPTSSNFQQAAFNPFQQQQMGQPQQFGATQPFAMPAQIQIQQTGFVAPQQTGMNPFGQQPQQPQQPFGGFMQPQQTGFVQPQQTGFAQPQQTGFLVPQATSANPFRQSMLMPQTTGMPFGVQQQQQPQAQPQVPFQTGSANPFPQANAFGGQQQSTNPFPGLGQQQQQPQQPSSNPFPNFNTMSLGNQQPSSPTNPFPSLSNQPSFASPFAQPASALSPSNAPPRSASVPAASHQPELQQVKTHQTGSRNPFGQPVATPPPVPKMPTLMDLAMGRAQPQQPQTNGSTSPTTLQPQQTGFNPGQNSSIMASVASSFAVGGSNNSSPGSSTSPPPSLGFGSTSSPTGSNFSNSVFSSLSSQPTGSTATSSGSSLQPQTTGFSGIKAFKPSSSFGAQLLESLPPIPQSQPTTPDLSQTSKHTPSPSLGSSSFLSSQPTGLGALAGKSPGVGLRPQMTGAAGAANPFRATMFSLSPNATGAPFGANPAPAGSAFGAPGGLVAQPTGFGGAFAGGPNQNLFGAGGNFGAFAGGQAGAQQQNGQQPSLI